MDIVGVIHEDMPTANILASAKDCFKPMYERQNSTSDQLNKRSTVKEGLFNIETISVFNPDLFSDTVASTR